MSNNRYKNRPNRRGKNYSPRRGNGGGNNVTTPSNFPMERTPPRTKSAPPSSNPQDQHKPAFLPEKSKYRPNAQRGDKANSFKKPYNPVFYPHAATAYNQYNRGPYSGYGYDPQRYPSGYYGQDPAFYPGSEQNRGVYGGYPVTPGHTAVPATAKPKLKSSSHALAIVDPATGKAIDFSKSSPGKEPRKPTPVSPSTSKKIILEKPDFSVPKKESKAIEIKAPEDDQEQEQDVNAEPKSDSKAPSTDTPSDAPVKNESEPAAVEKESKPAKTETPTPVKDAPAKSKPVEKASESPKTVDKKTSDKATAKPTTDSKKPEKAKSPEKGKSDKSKPVKEASDTTPKAEASKGKPEDQPEEKPASETKDTAPKEDSQIPAEGTDADSGDEKASAAASNFYEDSSWNPNNPGAKKQYGREFLLKFQQYCTDKPEQLQISLTEMMGSNDNFNRGGRGFGGRRSGGGRRFGSPNKRRRGGGGGGGNGGNGGGGRYNRGGPRNRQQQPREVDENAWVPLSRRNLDQEEKEKKELISKLNDAMNKMADRTYNKFSKQIVDLFNKEVKTPELLATLIAVIFDKALYEPKYSNLYAKLCVDLQARGPSFVMKNDAGEAKKITFKRLLLNKCQLQFEKQKTDDTNLPPAKRKQRVLGNVCFISELFCHGILTSTIMHRCVIAPLLSMERPDEDAVEALHKIMSLAGRQLDSKIGAKNMGAYFNRIKEIIELPGFSTRLACLLQDIVDLRQGGWGSKPKKTASKRIKSVSGKRTASGSSGKKRRNAQQAQDGWQQQSTSKSRRKEKRKNRGKPKGGDKKNKGGGSGNIYALLDEGRTSPKKDKRKKPKSKKQPKEPEVEKDETPAMSEEDMLGEAAILFEEYFVSEKCEEILAGLQKIPCKDVHKEILYKGIMTSFNRTDNERFLVAKVMGEGHGSNYFTDKTIQDTWSKMFEELPELRFDMPKSPDFVGTMLSDQLIDNALTPEWVRTQLLSLVRKGVAQALSGSLLNALEQATDGENLIPKLLGGLDVTQFFSDKDRQSIPALKKWAAKYQLDHLIENVLKNAAPDYGPEFLADMKKDGSDAKSVEAWINSNEGVKTSDSFAETLGQGIAFIVFRDAHDKLKAEADARAGVTGKIDAVKPLVAGPIEPFASLIKKYITDQDKQKSFVDGAAAFCRTKSFQPRGMMSVFFFVLFDKKLVSAEGFNAWSSSAKRIVTMQAKDFLSTLK